MEVLVHSTAAEEYRGIPEREQDAMDNAIAKLRALGDQLPYPHSSAVKGADRLRELRPRGAAVPGVRFIGALVTWRHRGLRARGQSGSKGLSGRRALGNGPPGGIRSERGLNIMGNRWTDTVELQEERFRKDAAAREQWERTALARAVAIAVVRYRAEQGLSQRALAKRLGMPQPHIARLELGEHNPSVDMLQRLAQGLGQRFVVAVAPADRAEELELPDGVQVLSDVRASDGSRLLAGAG